MGEYSEVWFVVCGLLVCVVVVEMKVVGVYVFVGGLEEDL